MSEALSRTRVSRPAAPRRGSASLGSRSGDRAADAGAVVGGGVGDLIGDLKREQIAAAAVESVAGEFEFLLSEGGAGLDQADEGLFARGLGSGIQEPGEATGRGAVGAGLADDEADGGVVARTRDHDEIEEDEKGGHPDGEQGGAAAPDVGDERRDGRHGREGGVQARVARLAAVRRSRILAKVSGSVGQRGGGALKASARRLARSRAAGSPLAAM